MSIRFRGTSLGVAQTIGRVGMLLAPIASYKVIIDK